MHICIERLEIRQLGGPIFQRPQYVFDISFGWNVPYPVLYTFRVHPEGLFRSGMYESIRNGPGPPMNREKTKKRMPPNSAPPSLHFSETKWLKTVRADGRVKEGFGPGFRIAL